jgi:hypothetical protein
MAGSASSGVGSPETAPQSSNTKAFEATTVSTQVSILTNPRCRHIAEAHARYLVSKYGASVDVLYIGSDGEGDDDERIDAMREEWSKLRLASGPATRFNDPERAVRRILFTDYHLVNCTLSRSSNAV